MWVTAGGNITLIFGFMGFKVEFFAGSEVLFGVGEEVVGAGADEEGATDVGVRVVACLGGIVGRAHKLLNVSYDLSSSIALVCVPAQAAGVVLSIKVLAIRGQTEVVGEVKL